MPSGIFPAVDASLTDFGNRVDEVRQSLYYCDVNFARTDTRLIRQGVRASSYVYLAASIEVHLNDTLTALVDEITASVSRTLDLRLSLFAIASSPVFDAISDVRGLKNWSRRCEVLSTIESTDPLRMDSGDLPLDGRTIRPEHFESVWRVFGLPGVPLPGSLHSLALRDLADSRNDVAHGNQRLAVVAGRKSIDDMLRMVVRVEEIGLHLWTAASKYLSQKSYLR